MFIEVLFKILLFKGGVLIYAEHCSSDVQNKIVELHTMERSGYKKKH